MAKSDEQKQAIARAYGERKSSETGMKSGTTFRLNLSQQRRDRLNKEKASLELKLAEL